jgi:hypothetical protein
VAAAVVRAADLALDDDAVVVFMVAVDEEGEDLGAGAMS